MPLIEAIDNANFNQTIFTTGERADSFHIVANLFQQLPHLTAMIVAHYHVMECLP